MMKVNNLEESQGQLVSPIRGRARNVTTLFETYQHAKNLAERPPQTPRNFGVRKTFRHRGEEFQDVEPFLKSGSRVSNRRPGPRCASCWESTTECHNKCSHRTMDFF